MEMEHLLFLFYKSWSDAFQNWIKMNKEAIGEKWYKALNRQLKKIKKKQEKHCNLTVPKIIGYVLWSFNMISSFGIMCGLGPDGPTLFDYSIPERFDRKSTLRLLNICSACLNLQYLNIKSGDR